VADEQPHLPASGTIVPEAPESRSGEDGGAPVEGPPAAPGEGLGAGLVRSGKGPLPQDAGASSFPTPARSQRRSASPGSRAP
jgi:hypothetical protein